MCNKRDPALQTCNHTTNPLPGRARQDIRSLAWLWRAAVACLLPGACALGAPIANSECMTCHDDPALVRVVGGVTNSLQVTEKTLKKSVHAGLSCTECHADIKELPHAEKLASPQCGSCHEEVAKEYSSSIHGMSQRGGASGAANCKDCHGSHQIVPVKQGESPVFKLNLPATCARCHSNPNLTAEYRIKYPDAAAQYMESVHGRALLKLGLTMAPSCNDCHGVHNIRRSVDRNSPIHHTHIADTCGKCHAGVEKTYLKSVHGQLLAKGDARGPVCTDCHTAHQIETQEGKNRKAESDARCGKCHKDRLENYLETYHGKAVALGTTHQAPEVAACYDCHGHHDVLPPSDPASRLSTTNILNTCQQCHKKATKKFTQYVPHADPTDRKNYPVLHLTFVLMTGLLVGTFAFFGLHTALWIFRSGYLFLHDSKTFREAKVSTQVDDQWFVRFVPLERMLHIMVVTSFLLLVITGMPLKFYYTDWAKGIFRILGGAPVARSLHHFAAVITFLYFALHLTDRVRACWRGRRNLLDPETGRFRIKQIFVVLLGPDSMVPNWNDWREFVAHQKWFFGKGPRPQFDRWTYWEKFDYLAVFWGVAMIGASGMIMWFPEFFTRFMPGWVINIAMIIHSDEALLAAGFIFTFHFFNTHFRIEKFPMDTVIFSGRISKTEMLHERRRWYERLEASGKLDEIRVQDEWLRWKDIARTFGYLFFGTGLILLVLIVMAMTARLLH
ncbi:MAG: cytochrome c3 family protein [Kiritimatiellia bacterium]